jgi:hypothetical protein
VVKEGAFNLAFGKAEGKDLNYGTSYIGFNATRNKETGEWKFAGDGAHNGGGVMWATIHGHLYLATIPSTGIDTQTLTDTQIKDNIKFHLTPEGNIDVNGDAKFDNIYVNNIYFPGAEMRIGKSGNSLRQNPQDTTLYSQDIPKSLRDTIGNQQDTTRYITDIITIKENGRVGIGTPLPEATLDIAGNIKA